METPFVKKYQEVQPGTIASLSPQAAPVAKDSPIGRETEREVVQSCYFSISSVFIATLIRERTGEPCARWLVSRINSWLRSTCAWCELSCDCSMGEGALGISCVRSLRHLPCLRHLFASKHWHFACRCGLVSPLVCLGDTVSCLCDRHFVCRCCLDYTCVGT